MHHRTHHIRLDHLIDYTGYTTGEIGAGKVYMYVISNESDSNAAPSCIYNSMLYFTDMQ